MTRSRRSSLSTAAASAFAALLALLVCAMSSAVAAPAPAAMLEPVATVFRAGKYARPARLATLTAKDLKYATVADNIGGLVDLAQAENRIDLAAAMQIRRRYETVQRGDELLFTCLRAAQCQPMLFADVASVSPLHKEIVLRRPAVTLAQANQAAGDVSEHLMDEFFVGSGWTKVNGQVGRQGIDGLYLRIDRGVVKNVLVGESKYNGSLLKDTNHGRQMSPNWLTQKLKELQAADPANQIYPQVARYIDEGSYRALLWNFKVKDKSIVYETSKVEGKGGSSILSPASPADLGARSTPAVTSEIIVDQPKNSFERRMVARYRAELNAVGPAPAL
jgi:hypothetical protein